MKEDKNSQKKRRPLSHNPLLKFKREENFLFDKKFMNDELRLQKYNLKNLREKWTQKVQTNFLKMDLKFGTSTKRADKNKVIYHYTINKGDLFITPSFLSNSSYLLNKKQNISHYLNGNGKYNDKISYYLSNKNPWNNHTCLEINKDNSSKDFNVHERLIKELSIRNKYKNSNEAKNISVKCIYYNNNYLQKKEKLREIIDLYIEDINKFVYKKYIKEFKMKRHGKIFFQKYLVFKEVIKRYKILFYEIISQEKNRNTILHKNNSETMLIQKKNEYISKIENVYEELYIIINYLKENKNFLNEIKNDKISLVHGYFEVLEKDEILRDKDISYIKFIKNFGNNNNEPKTNTHINIKNKNLLISRKRNGSCLNLTNRPFSKRKYAEYNISYYHPGTYYLFNEGENEYHAWSCCMNDDKKSKGCCKKTEKVPYFNYDIIV